MLFFLHEISITVSRVVQRDMSTLTTSNISVPYSSVDPERTHNTELTILDHMNDSQHDDYSELTQVSISMSGEENYFMHLFKDSVLFQDSLSLSL